MDPATFALTKLGFSLAGTLCIFYRQATAKAATTNELVQVRKYIQYSAKTMQQTITEAVQTIVNKLEQGQFELLLSRTRNLSDLVQMQVSDDTLVHSAMQLRECVDYAYNRFGEGKAQWLGPYLAGNSVFLASLQVANKLSADEVQRFKEFVIEAKTSLLEQAVPKVIDSSKKVPWRSIAEFLRDESAEVFGKLFACDPIPPEKQHIEARKSKGKSSDAHLVDQILLILRANKSLSGMYVGPEIPPRKLANAKSAAKVPNEENVLAVVDLTVFGSASDCLVFGSRGFYFYHSRSQCKPSPGFVVYDEFPECVFTTAWLNYVDLGAERYCFSAPPIRGKVVDILSAIRDVVMELPPER